MISPMETTACSLRMFHRMPLGAAIIVTLSTVFVPGVLPAEEEKPPLVAVLDLRADRRLERRGCHRAGGGKGTPCASVGE